MHISHRSVGVMRVRTKIIEMRENALGFRLSRIKTPPMRLLYEIDRLGCALVLCDERRQIQRVNFQHLSVGLFARESESDDPMQRGTSYSGKCRRLDDRYGNEQMQNSGLTTNRRT